MAIAAIHQPLTDIAASRHIHAQTIARILVNNAERATHHSAPLRLRQMMEINHCAVIIEKNPSGGRLIKTRKAA